MSSRHCFNDNDNDNNAHDDPHHDNDNNNPHHDNDNNDPHHWDRVNFYRIRYIDRHRNFNYSLHGHRQCVHDHHISQRDDYDHHHGLAYDNNNLCRRDHNYSRINWVLARTHSSHYQSIYWC
jgi:hypothetical protein